MAKDEALFRTENVVMVEYHDTTDWAKAGHMWEISDPTETVQLEGFDSAAVEETPWLRLKSLFGAWVDDGDEDGGLDELYRSRLTPSSMPHDDE